MELGQLLKQARNEAAMTQEQAAESLGVSRQTVSNWENGKTFPDIISVIKMSDLYSVSLDRLLKEEEPVKKTYREFLEESTNTVKSRDRQSKLILGCVTIGIWALSVILFFVLESGAGGAGYSLAISWAVLPIVFFCASFVMGLNDYFGKWKWLAVPLFGIMHALSGSITSIQTEEAVYRAVVWPDLMKLPVGMAIALIGIGIGMLIRKKNAGRDA